MDKKFLKEDNELKPLFGHDDGSMVSMEEVEEKLKAIPITEGQEPLQEIIYLNCTIEEYMKRNGCVFADEFDDAAERVFNEL